MPVRKQGGGKQAMKRLAAGIIVVALIGAIELTPGPGQRAEAAGAPVVMAVIGDYGGGTYGQQQVADLVDTWDVDFITTTGDNVYSADAAVPFQALDKKVGKYYHEYIYPYTGNFGNGSPTQTNRFFPALGNHDWGDPGVPLLNCSGNSCSGAWANYFNLPGNERYYDVRQGNLHLFVIDDYYKEPDGNKANSVQGRWLQNALAASDAEWKIVVNHFPPYSSAGSSQRIQWPFAEWGADVLLSGHHHVFERIQKGSMLYFVNGLGGQGKGKISGPAISGSKKRYNAEYGAMRLTADDAQLKIDFVNVKGAVIDSTTMQANGVPVDPPPNPAGDVFDATNWSGTGPYDVPAPDTRVDYPAQNGSATGDVSVGGTASHGVGVRHVEIVIRNTQNNRYWNPLTQSWQAKFIKFGVYASPRGWKNVQWSHTIPANKIGQGQFRVRAWARSYTGSGDDTGSNVVKFSVT